VGSVKVFGIGLLFGAALAAFSMRYHVVHTDKGIVVVPRSSQPPLRSVYVDVREWNLPMWQEYPEVSEAMVNAGHTDLIVGSGLNSLIPAVDGNESAPLFGETIQEDAQEAIGAMFPIRYSNPSGVQNSPVVPINETSRSIDDVTNVNRDVPIPIQIKTTTIPENRPINGQSTQTQIVSTVTTPPQKEAVEDILPNGIDLSQFALPQLQNPIPIEDDAIDIVGTSMESVVSRVKKPIADLNEAAKNPTESEWVSGLIKSLVPQNGTGTTPTTHGAARLPFEINAPSPNSGNALGGTSWLTPQQAGQPPVQAVRPF